MLKHNFIKCKHSEAVDPQLKEKVQHTPNPEAQLPEAVPDYKDRQMDIDNDTIDRQIDRYNVQIDRQIQN